MAPNLKADILAGMQGDESALETRPKKDKKRSPVEVVQALSPKQRQVLRARAEEIIAALDEVEQSEPEEES